MTVIEKLDELDAEVRAAEGRVRELELEQAKVRRVHDRALVPLRDYHRALGAGEIEPDPEREAELERELEAATRHVTRRPVVTGGTVSDFVAVDERVEARLAGATEALEAARNRRDGFLHRSRAELAAEMLPVAERAAREIVDHHDAAADARAAYHEASRRLHRFGVSDLPDDPRTDPAEVVALRRFAERGLLRPEEVS